MTEAFTIVQDDFYRSHRGTEGDYSRVDFPFGTFDNRGREHGAAILCYRVEMLPGCMEFPGCDAHTPPHRCGYTMIPGMYYVWVAHPTLAGKSYGHGQTHYFCGSEGERDWDVRRYIKNAKARTVRRVQLEGGK